MDTYVQRSSIKSDIPNHTDWYWGFVRDLLSGDASNGMEYYLDIANLDNISSTSHHIPDNVTFREQIKGLTPDQVRNYVDHVYDHYSENLWAGKVRLFLQNLDRDFETTMTDLNNALAAYVCRPTDDQDEDFHWPKFQIINAERYEVEINSITPDHKDQLVQLTGTLLYISDPPEMEYIQRTYLCHGCNDTFTTVDRTAECALCGKGPVEFLQDDPETLARNFQEGILQENVEDLTRSVASINIRFYDELINQFTPGDRVKLVGKVTVKQIPKKKSYFYWIDVFSCKDMDEELVNITQKDLEEIEEFRKTHRSPLDDLAEMFIPGIVGYREVKKAMILQAVSGVEIRFPDKTERGRIHILLAGDPGKAKSQFLLANKYIANKSFYLSDTSKAGLTVAISNVGQKRVMVPGIMVLANGGTACIDELDKMQKEDREGLHTAMEQGTISKSKAGLRGIFKANTSVLAAANPVYGRFDLEKDIPEQLKINKSLLDRFDLIFWFIDRPQARDEVIKTAMKILRPISTEKPEFLKKYIKLASEVKPVLTEDAAMMISTVYADLREGSPNGASIGIRSMHAIRRLSEASAKIRFSEVVEEFDIQTAKSLIIESIRPIGFDMDRLAGPGFSLRRIMDQIRTMLKATGGKMRRQDLSANLENAGIKSLDVVGAIETMKRGGELFEPSFDTVGLVQ
jgi:replicative DNA helicase Mcm